MNERGVAVNGWIIVEHPLFREEVEALIEQVERDKQRHPETYRTRAAAKRLAAIRKLAFQDIPSNPSDPRYRLGNTLGAANRVWRRAKFFQQYRLFFRYREEERVIVLAWVNNPESLRAYNSKRDAYRVFGSMLGDGNPPSTWQELISAANPPTTLAP